MGLFDGFKLKRGNNMYKFLPTEDNDEIVVGGTCKHIFKAPFRYSDFADGYISGEIIYKYKSAVVLTIDLSVCNIYEQDNYSLIEINLSPENTLLFNSLDRKAYCQLKLNLNGSVVYDDVKTLNVACPLDKGL